LAANPYLQKTSTFHSVQDAEAAINTVLRLRADKVASWAESAQAGSTLPLIGPTVGDIGVVLIRGASQLMQGRIVKVVLKKQPFNGMPYFVLTAYLDI